MEGLQLRSRVNRATQRLAGTAKQYSMKAMAQLATITPRRGTCLKRKWPYQASVNASTAKMLGITVPDKLLVAADGVIE